MNLSLKWFLWLGVGIATYASFIPTAMAQSDLELNGILASVDLDDDLVSRFVNHSDPDLDENLDHPVENDPTGERTDSLERQAETQSEVDLDDYLDNHLNVALENELHNPLAQSSPAPEREVEPLRDPADLTRPRPSNTLPALPATPPAPPPTPPLQVPSVSPPQPSPTVPDMRFRVDRIEVTGNTVLQDEIAERVAPFLNREVSFEELIELRSQITQLYLDNGYITSGAFIPNNQDLNSGVIQIQVIEGSLERVDISGLRRLRNVYVRSRINQAVTTPLNRQRLERALQLLQLDPLLEQVNAELTAGSSPGQSVLELNLREAPPLSAGIALDNYQSPSIGSEQIAAFGSFTNILGLGDRLNAQYGITRGLDLYDFSYSVPVNPANGTISVRYSNNTSTIVEDEFEDLDIESDSETLTLAFRQPVYRTPLTELGVGVGVDVRRSRTYILDDEPFSFSEGAEDGVSKVRVLRLFQDWVDRNASRVLAARSELRVGLDLFDATVNDSGTDGQFVSWLGQFQWVERIEPRILLVTRVNTQLTPDSLLSLERFSLGGVDTVRGYAQNELVTDNGIMASMEFRISLLPNLEQLQLVPFIDAGHAWNNRTPDPEVDSLVGIGMGLRWLITPDLDLRVDYGIPLVDIDDRGDSLQDHGIYLSLRYQAF